VAQPAGCQWDTENPRARVPGMAGVHDARDRPPGRADRVSSNLRSSDHVLSLPLAGAEPRLDGELEAAATSFAMQPGRAFLRPALWRFRGRSVGAGTFRYCMLTFEPELIARATGGQIAASAEVAPSVDLARPAIVRAMTALASQAERPGPGGRL